MQTITIDIINSKAMNLLVDLENLKLIKMHEDKSNKTQNEKKLMSYKGKMTKQPLDEINKQLSELRNEWE